MCLLGRDRYIVLGSMFQFNCSFQVAEYYHGGRPAGGRKIVVGGHAAEQFPDQAVVTGGRGRPITVEKVRVNILSSFSYEFVPRLI